jgi:hypothetical protein
MAALAYQRLPGTTIVRLMGMKLAPLTRENEMKKMWYEVFMESVKP